MPFRPGLFRARLRSVFAGKEPSPTHPYREKALCFFYCDYLFALMFVLGDTFQARAVLGVLCYAISIALLF
jgi:hypothetical protein